MFRAKVDTFKSLQSVGRRLASNPIAMSFALSLMTHFILISGVEIGRNLGWWKHSLLPQFGKSRVVDEVAKAEKQLQEQLQRALQQVPEAQLVFVEVDPAQAVPEPPKDAKYYSSQSTIASNPEPGDEEKPRIDGQQDKVPKTFDTLQPNTRPPEPAPSPKEEKEESASKETPPPKEPERPDPVEDAEPTRPQDPGETLIARAAPRPRRETPPQVEEKRPRTLAEAKARKGIIQGRKLRQEGGVRRSRLEPSENVRRSPFGDYDGEFIAAVQSSWYKLLDERQFPISQTGKVVVEFRLEYDGRISAVRVVEAESDVTGTPEWLCQRAILDVGKYKPLPKEMRMLMQKDYREIRFTFFYNQ